MITRVHSLHGFEIGAAAVGGVTRQSVNTGTEVNNTVVSAEVYPSHQAIVAQNPGASFESLQVGRLLSLVGLTGVDMSTLGSGVKFYAKKRKKGGVVEAAGLHRRYTFTHGILVLDSLSVQHQQDASITGTVHAIHDGSVNNPLIYTDGVSLPAVIDDQRYTLGPIVVEGVNIGDHVTSVDINFGVQVRRLSAKSDIWPTHVDIQEVMATVNIRGIDLNWLADANFPLLGRAATHANTNIYLRKRQQGGTFIPDVTTEHILLTCAGLARIDPAMDAQGNEEAETTLIMDCRFDGNNNPITMTTGVAIA